MFMIIVVVLFVLSWSEMAEMLTRSYLVIVGVANATQLCHLDGLSSTRVATQRGTILNCSTEHHHQDHYHHHQWHQYDQQQQGHDDHGTRSEQKPYQASNSLI